MKKIVTLAAAVLVMGTLAVAAASAYAGRKTVTLTTTGTVVQTDTTTALKVSAVTVKYAAPMTGTVYFYVTQSSNKLVRAQQALAAASVVVYVPEGLWLKQSDSITVSNSVSAAATVLVDLAYE